MSRDATAESNSSLHDEQPTRSTTKTKTFLVNCVLRAHHKTLEGHLMRNAVQQRDLDRCLLLGLRIVQRRKRELSHMAPALTILLQYGAKWNSDALLDDQKTPYHIICESTGDHHELLDLMMIKSSQQTIIDTQDIYERTALLYAVSYANIKCLKCLIANGADVNIGNDMYRKYVPSKLPPPWTAIMEAIGKMRNVENTSGVEVDIFDLLLNSGADVNKPTIKYQHAISPIMHAFGLRNVYCMQKLIEKGAHLDSIGNNNRYVWSRIAELGNVEPLKCVINHGLDKDSIVEVTIPSCMHKPDRGKKNEYTLSINQKNRDPYILAICHNRLEMVKLLDEYVSESCELFTALRYAVIYNSVDVASYLLNKYTYPLNMEYTLLLSQGRSTHTLLTEPRSVVTAEIIKLLLDHGADPAKPMSEATCVNAIMTAIHYGNLKFIAQYIRSGVDINFRSWTYINKKVSPFEASVLRGYHNVAEILLISGCSCGVFSWDNNHNFKNNLKPEVEKLMKEWKVQENNVTPLKQRCRSVVLNHLAPGAHMKIGKLPLPGCIIKFLSISEIDDLVAA